MVQTFRKLNDNSSNFLLYRKLLQCVKTSLILSIKLPIITNESSMLVDKSVIN